MNRLLRLLVIFARCPGCEARALRRRAFGVLVCDLCGVVVDADQGSWRFSRESMWRGMPGF